MTNKLQRLLQLSSNPLLYITLLATLIALFTIYRSLTQIKIDTLDDEVAKDDIPTITIYNPQIAVYNQQGTLAYNIDAEVIELFESLQKALLHQPRIEIINNQEQWLVTGRQIEYSTEQFSLSGNVVASNKQRQVTIHTNLINYNTNSQTIYLPEVATIEHPQALITANSTLIDTPSNEFTFSNRVIMKVK